MKVVVDTGPLVAAANRRDEAHELAADLVSELGRDLVIPSPVLGEVDHLLRARVGTHAARLFLDAIAGGSHDVGYLTPQLLRTAVAIDARFVALNLGLVDAAVMALAQRHQLPVLTFDFEDFRAAPPSSGFWQLVIDESRYHEAIG